LTSEADLVHISVAYRDGYDESLGRLGLLSKIVLIVMILLVSLMYKLLPVFVLFWWHLGKRYHS